MPRGERDDMLTWKLNRSSVFDVHSYYNLLADPDGSSTIPFPWKCIWSTKVPKRVSFFLWPAARGSILTIDNLVLRQLPLVNWCCMCWCDEEIVNHLLLHCKFAYTLWSETVRSIDLLKPILVGTLFTWAKIWGFTQCISISKLLLSIRTSSWGTCLCFKVQVFTIVNMMSFLWNKSLITYQKKKKNPLKHIFQGRESSCTKHI